MTVFSSSSDITAQVRTLLRYVLRDANFAGSQQLFDQAAAVQVVGGPITMLELKTGEDAAVSACPDGPIPLSMMVARAGESIGELLVWVVAGRLDSVEFAWWSDDAPTEFPDPTQVSVTAR